jgi:hypothetical protein
MDFNADILAAIISGIGGVLNWSNVVRLHKDRHVSGVNWWTNIYFMAAGCYSAFFLWHLHAHYAFFGTLVTVTANLAWVIQAFLFRNNRDLSKTR